MKNGAKMKKTGSRKSEKIRVTVFCSYDGVAGRFLALFYSVKGVWLIIKCSP